MLLLQATSSDISSSPDDYVHLKKKKIKRTSGTGISTGKNVINGKDSLLKTSETFGPKVD